MLTPDLRASISKELAKRTLRALRLAGAAPVVLAADDEVAQWGSDSGFEVILDQGSDLDTAAGEAVVEAGRRGMRWLIIHVDLPLLSVERLRPVVAEIARGGAVIAPSADGGNPLLGSDRTLFPFAYGPGSFQRHLRLLVDVDPLVLVDPGLAVDLDGPDDLIALRPKVPWLAEMTDTLPPS